MGLLKLKHSLFIFYCLKNIASIKNLADIFDRINFIKQKLLTPVLGLDTAPPPWLRNSDGEDG